MHTANVCATRWPRSSRMPTTTPVHGSPISTRSRRPRANATRLSDVAADLTLEPPNSTGDLAGPPAIDEDWLVISTVHSAKGLEWDVVHLLNAADGNFPSDMALTTREGLEEERRLFYVAVTRPRRYLHVYLPLRFHYRPRGRDDDHTMSQPSRFLSSAVAACFDTEHEQRHGRARGRVDRRGHPGRGRPRRPLDMRSPS